MSLVVINSADIAALGDEAVAAVRRRKNRNIHSGLDDPVQRLLNAFAPGTYVRPHRHAQPPKWELFIHLSGKVGVLTFDDAGRVAARVILEADGVRVLEIAPGTWHTLVALAPGSVVCEVKPGPYLPTAPADLATWAPAENESGAGNFCRWFESALPGSMPFR